MGLFIILSFIIGSNVRNFVIYVSTKIILHNVTCISVFISNSTVVCELNLVIQVYVDFNPFDTEPLAIFLLLENDNLGIIH